MNEIRIGFIGAGNMAQALISGLVNQGFQEGLIACDPCAETRQKVSAHYGIRTSADNSAALADSDAVILAVKPQIMDQVLASIQPAIAAQQLIISIAAGITWAQIHAGLTAQQPIVRAMPNTPALIGAGITGLAANAMVSDSQRQLAQRIMAATGEAVWVEHESQIDAVTAVSGSGPAYFFLLIEALAEAGKNVGLNPDIAARLALVTGAGACQLALQTEDASPAELRQRVTSPGGTTAAALEVLQNDDFAGLLAKAVQAAQQRGQQLASTQ